MCKSVNEKVPYFNAPIYFENKAQVGKVDEIFGQVSNHVSLALDDCLLLLFLFIAIFMFFFNSLLEYPTAFHTFYLPSTFYIHGFLSNYQ